MGAGKLKMLSEFAMERGFVKEGFTGLSGLWD